MAITILGSRPRHHVLRLTLLLGCLAASAPLAAQKVRGATSGVVDVGGTYAFAIPTPFANTYNQLGLIGPYTSGVTDWNTYFAGGGPFHGDAMASEWWSLASTSSATVTWDLGAAYTISGLALWNEEAHGIGSFNLFYSTDGTTFFSLLSGQVPTNHPDPGSYKADIFSMAATSMRYVRMEMSGCPAKAPPFSAIQHCVIGEVAFREELGGLPGTTTPEPATVGLLATGLIGIAGAGYLRRRKRTA